MKINQNKQKQRYVSGIGVDICNIRRMYEKISSHGDKFAEKILTSYEYSLYKDIDGRDKQAQYVAKCWAVKEAFVKAMGTGFTDDYTWNTIGYFSPRSSYTNQNRPRVQLSDAIAFGNDMKNKTIHLSVSDEVDNVIAFVTIEEERS